MGFPAFVKRQIVFYAGSRKMESAVLDVTEGKFGAATKSSNTRKWTVDSVFGLAKCLTPAGQPLAVCGASLL